MLKDGKVYFGKSGEEEIYIYPKMANRHGLIAGATGTGKTVTLKVLAESFSEMGVPVFMADAKGDLAGIAAAGVMNDNMSERLERFGLIKDGFEFKGYTASFFDVFAESGIPLRTTISEMGPLLLSRIMGLNQIQTDIMQIVFKIADDENLILTDTKDLREMLRYVGENAAEYSASYGSLARQSIAAITRAVVVLESAGGEMFFGEPALDLHDWFGTDSEGRGRVHILACEKLMNSPSMYATFMLWLMSELFNVLPEEGDLEKPKLVFFFDEAHMLFNGLPKVFLEKIEQVVKLIRSKGIGIYFITQNPRDIPDSVLAQLGNKIQHALHAYTPTETKAVKAAAASFRENPEFDTYDTLLTLGIGEALVSVLDDTGIPTVVKRVNILPPQSSFGKLDDLTRNGIINNDPLYSKYAEAVDNDSAYELLKRIEAERAEDEEELEKKLIKEKEDKRKKAVIEKQAGKVGRVITGTVGREIGNSLGKSIGGTFGKRLGGNLGAALGRGLLDTLFGRK